MKITIKKIIWGVVIVAAVVGLFIGIQWATYARPPLSQAVEALVSDDLVTVTEEPWLTFTPNGDEPETGFIFYPGGRVNPQGYAALLHVIAAEGYLVVVPSMPINMAIFDSNSADEIIAAHPQIENWVIGGHSVGGVSAFLYTHKNQEVVSGMVSWAAYPAASSDLSDSEVPVVLIYGTLDDSVNDSGVGERKHLLPADTVYVRIEGGGHHQFGDYLITPEEHESEIPREEQQAQILEATLSMLAEVSGE